MTKRKCKKLYREGKIFLGEALECLMFEHGLMSKEAIDYLNA